MLGLVRTGGRGIAPVTLTAAVALAGWRRGALTADGAVAATAVGASTFGRGGLDAGLALVAFFATGSALSRRGAVRGEVAAAKGHRRDAMQVLANGGIAALAALISGGKPGHARGATIGAVATAAADTWASEIGVRSPTPPRSVVSGQVVRPGTSGGVTPLGWAAAAAGALVVGGTFAAFEKGGPSRVRTLLAALIAGLVGSLADSLAGATLQASYACPVCGSPAESPAPHCGQRMRTVHGRAWVTNDVVNLIGTASGAAVGGLLA
jgi:uncharacterized protein (TIGR00297 family)